MIMCFIKKCFSCQVDEFLLWRKMGLSFDVRLREIQGWRFGFLALLFESIFVVFQGYLDHYLVSYLTSYLAPKLLY